MSDFFVGAGGEWKRVLSGSAVGVGGEWKDIQEGFVGAGGEWKRFFIALQLKLTNVLVSGGSAQGGIEFTRAGALRFGLGADSTWTTRSDEWVEEGAESDTGDAFEVRLQKTSGDDPSFGPALNTWVALSEDRRWTWNPTSGFTRSFEGVMTVRDIATSGGKHEVSAELNVFVVNV